MRQEHGFALVTFGLAILLVAEVASAQPVIEEAKDVAIDAPADGEEGLGLDLLAQPSLHVRDEAVLPPVDLVLSGA